MTGAQFVNVLNIPGRAIVATHNHSPTHAIDQDEAVEIAGQLVPWQRRLPEVQRWSDVVGALWADRAGEHTCRLKYIFRQGIVTPKTMSIMCEVLKRQRRRSVEDLSFKWPGCRLRPSDEDFRALLGTPHGAGIAFLLRDHPVEMPNK